MSQQLKTIKIPITHLIDLSEGIPIEMACEKCRENTDHEPMKSLIGGNKVDHEIDPDTGVEIETIDVLDSYIVQCMKCGNIVVAKWTPEPKHPLDTNPP